MSMRQNPPRQSPAHRARKPVTIHQSESVGHNIHSGRRGPRPAILDPQNGESMDGGSRPVTTGAMNEPSSW
jgi:hypothetical protein